MSGKELKQLASAAVEEQEEQADDDFGDFEGFNNVGELEASVAQPLPQALQANWGSFPDYVPSQRTMSSSLQPDLLPTQASIGDINGSNRIDQEHFLQDDDDDNGGNQYPPCDLPVAAANSPQLHLHLHPDLALPDLQLPDVSPQGGGDVPAKPSLLGNLPDISPVGCRPSHLSDLPDVSETRPNQSVKAKCDNAGAALDAQPCCSKSLASGSSPSNVNDNAGMVVSGFQHKFEELERQNQTLMQELTEMKSQNVQFQQTLTECVGIIRQDRTAKQEESSLRLKVSHLCEEMVTVKAAKDLDDSSAAGQTKAACSVALETKLSEQKITLDDLQNHVANQDEQIVALRTEMAAVSRNVESVWQSQQEAVGILKQTLDELKSDRQQVLQKMESIESALNACLTQVEKKVDQRTYTAKLLDTLLLGAHGQLQELVKPDNGPSS